MAGDPPRSPLWEVTSQQETVDLIPNGSYVTGTRVSFRTRSGALGSVFVSNAEYSVPAVKALLDKRAADLEAIHTMTGEG